MKKYIISIVAAVLLFSSCQKLDFNPLSEGSSENWFSNENEITLALNDLYRGSLWYVESSRLFNTDRFSDDWNQREYLYDWVAGGITGEWNDTKNTWENTYKGIARANTILAQLEKAEGIVSETRLNQFKGEARFFRAAFYSYLVFLYGDVPLVTDYITIEEAFNTGRTPKAEVLEQIYEDFDIAIEYLPVTHIGLRRVTKGVAYAFKARTATWMLDYPKAKGAAWACMQLGQYSLHPDFAELFQASTRVSSELIFSIPRSRELTGSGIAVGSMIPRNSGGTATAQPSWELFHAFLCTDGLPVDQSPLYNPQRPFQHRDPRLAQTMVEFGTQFLGFVYDPFAASVQNLKTDQQVTNKDALLNDQFAAYNGMALKKFVDETWMTIRESDKDVKIIRYADVLLMYAEAKIESNEIDQSVLDAINAIRARAYKVGPNLTSQYPAVTTTNQTELRKILRLERRMELAWENRRWFDLIRWRLAEVAMRRPIYALPTADGLRANIASGDYPFPKGVLPVIDNDGLVDLMPLYNTGKVREVVPRNFSNRQYLFPIPSKEILINPENMKQNDDY